MRAAPAPNPRESCAAREPCPRSWTRCRSSPALPHLIFQAQDGHEGFLRQLDAPDALHALFAGLLLLEQLALAGDVAAVAFGEDVLAYRADGFARDDLSADCG